MQSSKLHSVWYLSMNDQISPPGIMLQMMEARAGAEAGRLMLSLPLIRMQAARGHNEPVMVLPGFMADDYSTLLLRQFLKSIGYQAYPWNLGVNRRRMMDFLPALIQQATTLADRHKQKVRLIGWSRGGILSREVARDRPELIDRVITLGSPIKGGVSASSIGNMVKRETGMSAQELTRLLKLRQLKPIDVPIRAVYSKTDGVVSWKACIDDVSADVQHFEISGTHVGMGANADVYRLLPRLLAEDLNGTSAD